MRRWTVLLLAALLMPVITVSADQDPFNFYIEEEIIAHPGETVQLRIAWQNIVGTERHFSVSLNNTGSNISVSDLPTDWTRVASGRLGEILVNVTVAPTRILRHNHSVLISCVKKSLIGVLHTMSML